MASVSLHLSGVTPGQRISSTSHRESLSALCAAPLTHDPTRWSTAALCWTQDEGPPTGRRGTGCGNPAPTLDGRGIHSPGQRYPWAALALVAGSRQTRGGAIRFGNAPSSVSPGPFHS